jgi:hypothetical protein
MKTLRTLLAAALLFAFGAAPANAFTVTFDDIYVATNDMIVNYQGATWENFYVANGSAYSNGYTNGTVSPNNVGFNGYGNPATVTSPNPFTFVSAYFTGAWNDDLSVTVQGFLNNVEKYSTTFLVNSITPSLMTLNMSNIDKVTFSTSGGTAHGYIGGDGTHVAIDNIEISEVPLPAALPLFGSAFASLLGVGAWRKRKEA